MAETCTTFPESGATYWQMTTKAPHYVMAHLQQEQEYDAMLSALTEAPKSEAVEVAQSAIRVARVANSGRGKRIVHEWPELHAKAIAAFGVVNSQASLVPPAPVALVPVATLEAAPAPAIVAPLVPAASPLSVVAAVPMPVAAPAKAPPSYRVDVVPNAEKHVFEATVFRNDLKVAVCPVRVPVPAYISSEKPSLRPFGGTVRTGLLFVFRGMTDGGGLPLEAILNMLVDPLEHESVREQVSTLIAEGHVETAGGNYRLSTKALHALLTERERILRHEEKTLANAVADSSAPLHDAALS